MLRHCNGNDPVSADPTGAAGNCGRTFETATHSPVCPHRLLPIRKPWENPFPPLTGRPGAIQLILRTGMAEADIVVDVTVDVPFAGKRVELIPNGFHARTLCGPLFLDVFPVTDPEQEQPEPPIAAEIKQQQHHHHPGVQTPCTADHDEQLAYLVLDPDESGALTAAGACWSMRKAHEIAQQRQGIVVSLPVTGDYRPIPGVARGVVPASFIHPPQPEPEQPAPAPTTPAEQEAEAALRAQFLERVAGAGLHEYANWLRTITPDNPEGDRSVLDAFLVGAAPDEQLPEGWYRFSPGVALAPRDPDATGPSAADAIEMLTTAARNAMAAAGDPIALASLADERAERG